MTPKRKALHNHKTGKSLLYLLPFLTLVILDISNTVVRFLSGTNMQLTERTICVGTHP